MAQRLNKEQQRRWDELVRHVESKPELAAEWATALTDLDKAVETAMFRIYGVAISTNPSDRVAENVEYNIRDGLSIRIADLLHMHARSLDKD